MCGIVCAFDLKQKAAVLRPQLLEMSKKVRHRGPDWNGIYSNQHAILAHERLAIVDPTSGKQPLFSDDKKLVLAANGEIYNHRELRKQFEGTYNFQTESDCEVILALYKEKGTRFLDELNGIFGFAIYDVENDSYFIARDHVGIIPLYIGWDQYGTFYVASELKALEGVCTKIELFPPGHYFSSKDGKFVKWYHRDWSDYSAVKDNETSIEELKEALEAAVHRQLMSDVPYGVLLSGGLDSSITSAIAKKYAEKRIESGDTQDAWWPQLHSFSVGLEGSPDLAAAQKVASHIG
ncbi:MAG TPA: asparagine synthase (glutamine-hydrolyzing), partial [Flavobacteriia bacterium]|nr:asparagine synthase (glutamine-hydrolyzing) [Flavobacteriia bacterium]